MELIILFPTVDALRDFHRAAPLWIYLNDIIELSYLQQIYSGNEFLSWQDILYLKSLRTKILLCKSRVVVYTKRHQLVSL